MLCLSADMYFSDRIEAGEILAKRLQQYRGANTSVIALSIGGALVGAFIARQLGAKLTLLLTRDVMLPGEPTSFGTMSQTGEFTYNSNLAKAEIDEYNSEFHNHIEAEKLSRLFELNKVTGKHTMTDRQELQDHTIILVSDGITNAAVLDVAYEYLKPVRIKRLIAAIPLATVKVVDRLHILTDEIHVLSVIENTDFDIDHYYTDNELPKEEDVLSSIDQLAQV